MDQCNSLKADSCSARQEILGCCVSVHVDVQW